MVTSATSLTFPMSDGDLVFDSVDGTGFTIVTMSRPPLQARIVSADESPNLAGSLATQAVWQQSVLTAGVMVQGATPAELETRLSRVNQVLGQFSYTAVQVINGQTRTWTCDMGSVVPTTDVDLEQLLGNLIYLTLTIPVQPLGA